MNNRPSHNPGEGPGRFIGAVFGFVFFGIGLTVIGFLWLTPFDQFGSPPLFFRIFGSFIATAFVAVGGATAYAAITGTQLNQTGNRQSWSQGDSISSQPSDTTKDNDSVDSSPSGGYSCDKCAAPLNNGADVSPHGDVKCDHCGCWFNVHSK